MPHLCWEDNLEILFITYEPQSFDSEHICKPLLCSAVPHSFNKPFDGLAVYIKVTILVYFSWFVSAKNLNPMLCCCCCGFTHRGTCEPQSAVSGSPPPNKCRTSCTQVIQNRSIRTQTGLKTNKGGCCRKVLQSLLLNSISWIFEEKTKK